MKTLKISLLVVAVVVLTVSVVSRDNAVKTENVEYKNDVKQIDLLAHRKNKIVPPTKS